VSVHDAYTDNLPQTSTVSTDVNSHHFNVTGKFYLTLYAVVGEGDIEGISVNIQIWETR